ncbi:major facilitator superfamily domain-containing protein [Mycena filopes]|nr:major facilitator superfamily domain-containing protein [Mycena filopes]
MDLTPAPTTPDPQAQASKKVDENPPPPTHRAHQVRERIQLVTLCWTLFLAGWNDGSVGPLIPRIQQMYHVGYTVVSLIFVLQCVGCLGGAVLNILSTKRYGLGKLMLISSSCFSGVAYALQAAALPFPVFVLAGVINGIGLAIQDAQANGYVASLANNSDAKMGYVQAAYGAGALVAPLVSTQFAQLPHWSFHYLISVGLMALNTLLLGLVFRGKSQDECLSQIGQQATAESSNVQGDEERSHFRQIISLKAVHILALFLFVYVGVEVTIGGWIVSFMISLRGGGASAGYISAGFFGGLTLGRILLIPVNRKVGERRVVYIYGLLAIALELTIWLVPSLPIGATAASLTGLVLGPIYPLAMLHAARLFPHRLLTGAIGWIAAIGTAGAAVVPFVTGAVASRVGIISLEPVIVAMLTLMLVMWGVVPARRLEEA